MAKRRYGSFDMDAAIEPKINMPLDARQHVRTKTERLDPESFPADYSYKGLLVASRDEEKVFFLVDHNNSQLEESWKLIGPYDDTEIRRLINEVDNRITDQTITGGTGISVTRQGDNYVITNTSSTGGEDRVFIAEYGVTSAQEIIEYLGSEPFAPVIVKRGNEYSTSILSVQRNDNSVLLRTFGSNNGDYYIFNFTVTDTTWASSSYGLQKKLVSGTDIKTINGETLIGEGDITIQGGLPTDFDIVNGNNVQVVKSGNTYTISATDTDTKTVLTAGDNVTITDNGNGGNHNYRIDVADSGPDDYMVYSKNSNIIITAMGNDQEENIFLYDASIAGATADNNQLSDFETGTDKIEIKGTSLPKGQLTQFATQGAGIYYSNGILSYNDGTNLKTIVKVVDGSTVAAADVTII